MDIIDHEMNDYLKKELMIASYPDYEKTQRYINENGISLDLYYSDKAKGEDVINIIRILEPSIADINKAYINTAIALTNGENICYRYSISHDLYRFLSSSEISEAMLYGLNTFDSQAMVFLDQQAQNCKYEPVVVNKEKPTFSMAETLEKYEREYEAQKKENNLRNIVNPKRSIRNDLFIAQYGKQDGIDRILAKEKRQEDRKLRLKAKWTIFKMNLTSNDDTFLFLAKELESMLQLPQEEII